MDSEQIKKNADFLMKNLSGIDVQGEAKFRCKYRKMVQFAKIYGYTDKKYIGDVEDEIIACPAFANAFTVKSFYILVPAAKIEQDGKMRPIALVPTKILHAGNTYHWENCVPIKAGDTITSKAKIGKVWVIEKSMMLFAELYLTAKNQNNELVCNVTSKVAISAGGY